VSYDPCNHKSDNDHMRRVDGVRLWRCSNCDTEAEWDKRWRYFGSIECSRCWAPRMDVVACSDACRDACIRDGVWPQEKKRR